MITTKEEGLRPLSFFQYRTQITTNRVFFFCKAEKIPVGNFVKTILKGGDIVSAFMFLIGGIVIGLIFGFFIGIAISTGKGTLRIDHSDPNKDRYLFEVDDLDHIRSKSRLVITIDHEAKIAE